MRRLLEMEHGIDDAPLLLDRVLAREEARVAAQRVAEQPLVGQREARLAFRREQLDLAADPRLARALDVHAEGERGDAGADAEAEILGRGFTLGVDVERRSLELHAHL